MTLDGYMRNAYIGGLTYLNPKYAEKLITEHMASWDRVSSYPSVMIHEWLPAGKPKMSYYKPKDRLYIVRFRVYHAKVKEGYHPFIPNTKAFRLIDTIYPTEFEERVLTLSCIDFEQFNKYYVSEYEIIDYVVFPQKVRGIFNDYILEQFN